MLVLDTKNAVMANIVLYVGTVTSTNLRAAEIYREASLPPIFSYFDEYIDQLKCCQHSPCKYCRYYRNQTVGGCRNASRHRTVGPHNHWSYAYGELKGSYAMVN